MYKAGSGFCPNSDPGLCTTNEQSIREAAKKVFFSGNSSTKRGGGVMGLVTKKKGIFYALYKFLKLNVATKLEKSYFFCGFP